MPDITPSRDTDSLALARALTAFRKVYGHGLTWTGVLPLLEAASNPPHAERHDWDAPRPAGEFAERFRQDGWPR